jgi:NAD(P)H-hydrate epimerase
MGVVATDGLPQSAPVPREPDLVIDALVGYGLTGPLAGPVAELASWAGRQRSPVLALDAPTGLDVTTGRASPGAIRAAATLTLALPTPGLLGAGEVGELYLADISVPAAVYRLLGLEVPVLFAEGPVIRLQAGVAGRVPDRGMVPDPGMMPE